MKRMLGAILFVLYSIVAITVTILLLSYNNYNISEVGDYTVYIANNDLLEPAYEKGSILIIEKASDKNVKVGDEILLYQVINSQEFEVVTRNLVGKVQQGRHIVYEVEGGETYASDYFIGKTEDVTVIGSPWGTILSILESKWGYLFCIVIVSLLLFLQEVFDLIIEIKYGAKAKNGKVATKAASAKGTKVTTTAKKPAATKRTSTSATTTKKVATATTKVETTTQVNKDSQTGEKEG